MAPYGVIDPPPGSDHYGCWLPAGLSDQLFFCIGLDCAVAQGIADAEQSLVNCAADQLAGMAGVGQIKTLLVGGIQVSVPSEQLKLAPLSSVIV